MKFPKFLFRLMKMPKWGQEMKSIYKGVITFFTGYHKLWIFLSYRRRRSSTGHIKETCRQRHPQCICFPFKREML